MASWEDWSALVTLIKRKQHPENGFSRSVSVRPIGGALAPLMEGPEPEDFENSGKKRRMEWLAELDERAACKGSFRFRLQTF